MSAQRAIKLSSDLRIRGWEHQALVATMNGLNAGRLRIDMRQTGSCLGSLVARSGANRDPATYMGLVYSYALRTLYFPGIRDTGEIDFSHPAWDCHARQAARAIKNFLEVGRPCWSSVMFRQKDL